MRMKRLAAALSALMLLCIGIAQGEGKKTMFEQEWYLQALQNSVMSRGNNARLKKVIERAKDGEEIGGGGERSQSTAQSGSGLTRILRTGRPNIAI